MIMAYMIEKLSFLNPSAQFAFSSVPQTPGGWFSPIHSILLTPLLRTHHLKPVVWLCLAFDGPSWSNEVVIHFHWWLALCQEIAQFLLACLVSHKLVVVGGVHLIGQGDRWLATSTFSTELMAPFHCLCSLAFSSSRTCSHRLPMISLDPSDRRPSIDVYKKTRRGSMIELRRQLGGSQMNLQLPSSMRRSSSKISLVPSVVDWRQKGKLVDTLAWSHTVVSASFISLHHCYVCIACGLICDDLAECCLVQCLEVVCMTASS